MMRMTLTSHLNFSLQFVSFSRDHMHHASYMLQFFFFSFSLWKMRTHDVPAYVRFYSIHITHTIMSWVSRNYFKVPHIYGHVEGFFTLVLWGFKKIYIFLLIKAIEIY